MATQSPPIDLFAEDDDPRIAYSGEWSVVSPWKPGEFGATARVTTQPGASATLRFQGSAVKFYVSLPPISGERNSVVDLTIIFDGETIQSQTYAGGTRIAGITPFSRGDLDPSQVHELVVVYRGSAEFGDPLPLRFDGIRWTVSNSPPVVPQPPTATTTTQSGSSSLRVPASSPQSGAIAPQAVPIPSPSPMPTSAVLQPPEPQPSTNISTSLALPSSTLGEAESILSDGRVVTKILPQDRVATLSDSVESLSLPAESEAAAPPPVSGQISTGFAVAIAVSVVAVMALIGIGALILFRRRRKRSALAMQMKGAEFREVGSRSDLEFSVASSYGAPIHHAPAEGSRGIPSGNKDTGPQDRLDLLPPAYDHTIQNS